MNSDFNIKTLDDILKDLQKSNAKSDDVDDKNKNTKLNHNKINNLNLKNHEFDDNANPPKPLNKKIKKPKESQSTITPLLTDKNQSVFDDKTLQLLSEVEIQKLDIPDKATRYLRWLAFYYLSRRELSAWQLKKKLLAKECDPVAVDELLAEFAEKGYQSDERCATMMVREAVRKGRGVRYLADELKKAKLDARDFGGMDNLIELAGIDGLTDGTILENDENERVDWLKLAVEARTKKYGDHIPKDPKEKARQLRFLQYRGFEMDVCFDALKMTLADFYE